MDTKELLARLAREGFNPLYYRLDASDGGEASDDCYCLREAGACWEVYYFERGVSRTLAIFAEESAACEYFFARLNDDPSARSHLLAWFPEQSKADELVNALLQAGIKATHRDAPAFAHVSDIRHRIFVDGRDLECASRIRDGTGQA
jgi:hypothetical protein